MIKGRLFSVTFLLLLHACGHQKTISDERKKSSSSDSSSIEIFRGLSVFLDGYARMEDSRSQSIYINEKGEKVEKATVTRTMDSTIFDVVGGSQSISTHVQLHHIHPGDPLGNVDMDELESKDSIRLTTRYGISMWGKKGQQYEDPSMRGHTLTAIQYGFTNVDGKPLLATEYDYYHEYELTDDETGYPDYLQFFITDKYLRLVKQDETGILKMGLANHKGDIIVPIEYDMLYPFTFEKQDYIIYRKGGELRGYNYMTVQEQEAHEQGIRYGVMEGNGRIIIPPVIAAIGEEFTHLKDQFMYLSFPLLGYDLEEQQWVYYTSAGEKLFYRGRAQIGFRE